MGTVTNATRHGDIQYYKMNAFFSDVLVQARCVYGLSNKLKYLYFDLTFQEKTDFSNIPSKYLPKDLPMEVLNKIALLSNNDDKDTMAYEVKRAVKENKMAIKRPKPHSFEQFKEDMLNTLEKLEKIFQKHVSKSGSVKTLSFSHGFGI